MTISSSSLSSSSSLDNNLEVDKVVDACGDSCPMPLLKAKKNINSLKVGEKLKVLATDSGSVRDFHAWAEYSGHQLLFFEESDGCYIYVLQKT